MDEQLVLKNRLKVARAERGLSQGDLAKLVGVSRQTHQLPLRPASSTPPPSWPWCCASRWTKNLRSFSISEINFSNFWFNFSVIS